MTKYVSLKLTKEQLYWLIQLFRAGLDGSFEHNKREANFRDKIFDKMIKLRDVH